MIINNNLRISPRTTSHTASFLPTPRSGPPQTQSILSNTCGERGNPAAAQFQTQVANDEIEEYDEGDNGVAFSTAFDAKQGEENVAPFYVSK
jgi:hypothetical protein